MFDMFFSFRGRIGRLRYFTTAIGSFVILLGAATLGAISISWRQNPVAGLFALVGIVLVVAVVAMWSSLSLQARRLRDIGLDPVLVIPLHIGLNLVFSVAALRGGHAFSPLGGLLSLAYSAALLFWPGRGDRTPDLEAIFGGEPEPARAPAGPASAYALPPPAASSRLAPSRPLPPSPGRPTKTFGRRGMA